MMFTYLMSLCLVRRCEQLGYSMSDCESLCSPVGMNEAWDEQYWFQSDATRQDAARLLNGKPEGTFLVRYIVLNK